MATRHLALGKYGEQLARSFLGNACYDILFTNWKHANYEVDIIGKKNSTLHFIEVKTRRSLKYGYPEDDVDEKKLKKIMSVAEEFLFRNPQWKRVQYDILSICLFKGKPPEFLLIEDVSL